MMTLDEPIETTDLGGAGQIRLRAASLTGRPLIQVDRDPVAAAYARRNAAATGIQSDVRAESAFSALDPGPEASPRDDPRGAGERSR